MLLSSEIYGLRRENEYLKKQLQEANSRVGYNYYTNLQ